MANRYSGLKDGREITKAVREDVGRSGVVMDLHRQWEHIPNETRRYVRADETAKARQAMADGRAAMQAWADAETKRAERVLASREVGTAAEESRRVAGELRISRMIEASRSKGSSKADAEDLAERAAKAYRAGDGSEAEVLARAAVEMGGDRRGVASEIVQSVALDRDLADPARAKAIRDLQDVAVVTSAFLRDASATYSQTLRDSAALARATGEVVNGLAAEGARYSSLAKIVAADGAQRFGGTYEEPVGALPGVPKATVQP